MGSSQRWRRLRALGRLGAGLGWAPRAVLLVACLAIGLMYCTNDDMGGDPRSPRGDGRYRPVLARGDGHMLYLMARSLVFDGDLVFDNDLARFGDPWQQARTRTGRKGIPHPIGPALVWAPMLAAAQGGAVVANAAGADIQTHGYTLWHQRIVFLSSAVFGCVAVLLGVWVFRRHVGGRWAPTWAAVAVLLGTSITYYATYMPSYGHAMDAAFAGTFLAVWAVTVGDLRWRRWALLGVLLGAASLVRSQEMGLGIVVVVEIAGTVLGKVPPDRRTEPQAQVPPDAPGGPPAQVPPDAQGGTPAQVLPDAQGGVPPAQVPPDAGGGVPHASSATSHPGRAKVPPHARGWRWRVGLVARGGLVLAVALLVMVPQFVAWEVVYGQWTSLPQGPNYTRPAYPMVAELLFSARNGWFSTTPVAYAGVLGLALMAVAGVRLGTRVRIVALGLLAAVALQVYANSIILDWWGQASYGARRLCSMTMPLVVGLAVWLHVLGRVVARLRWPRLVGQVVAIVVLGWFVTWNLGWVQRFRSGRAPERRAGPICCKGVPAPLAAIAQPVYRVMGNPFALPASAVFSWRYRLPLSRWDQVVGDYPFHPAIDYTRESIRGTSASWDLGGAGTGPYIVRGFGPVQAGPGRSIRWTTAPAAVVLVPNLLPGPLRLSLWMAPNAAVGAAPVPVVVRWNGRVVARAVLSAPEKVPPEKVPPTPSSPRDLPQVTWDIAGDVGLNVLSIEAPISAPAGFGGTWRPGAPAGVAVGVLTFTGI